MRNSSFRTAIRVCQTSRTSFHIILFHSNSMTECITDGRQVRFNLSVGTPKWFLSGHSAPQLDCFDWILPEPGLYIEVHHADVVKSSHTSLLFSHLEQFQGNVWLGIFIRMSPAPK
jgi:hypothetical protein